MGRARSTTTEAFVVTLVWLATGAIPNAAANEGRPYPRPRSEVFGGSEALGMPTVTIRRERLDLDFRGLEHSEPPRIRATYELDNEAGTLTVPLVFASFDIESGRVTFDGTTIASKAISSAELPDAWMSPGGPVASTLSTQPSASGLAFELEIPPGEHELEVTYTVAGDFQTWNATGHVVSYDFSPAVSWKALQRLEVTLHCAPNWSCTPVGRRQPPEQAAKMPAPTVPLTFEETEPGTSRAVTTGLPKRPLHVLLQRPAPWWIRLRLGALLLAAPFLVVLGVLGAASTVLRPKATAVRILSWLGVSLVILVLSFTYGVLLGAAHAHTRTVLGGYASLGYLAWSILVGLGIAIAAAVVAVLRARTQ